MTPFRERFPDITIGLSSHDNGIAMAVVGYMLGARVIEKHFTLNHTWKGTDHAFSLEPIGMKKMVRDLRRTRVAMGDGVKKIYETEVNPLIKMGKKLVAARGRHDPCVGIRATPIVEAMLALVLMDHVLRHRGQIGT